MFLDPFATELLWSTVEALAGTQIVDCWILFPLGAVVRLMPLKHDPNPELACRLDRVFGGRQHWYNSLYQSTEQLPLFGEQSLERSGGHKKVTDLYRQRLNAVFEKVAPARILRNSKNAPLFALYFAASNKKGADIAVRIADHLLKKW